MSVTLSEALTGFSRIVLHHLDGRGISVNVPPGRVINNGDSFKVEGEGMPQERSQRKGDLWLKFEIEKIDEDWAKKVDLEVNLFCCQSIFCKESVVTVCLLFILRRWQGYYLPNEGM